MIRFTVDLQRTGVDPSYVTRNVIRGTMKYSSEELRRQLTQNSPKGETKFLYASWYIEESGDLQRAVYSDVKYAEWVNNGTGLFGPRHDVIRPRRASVLVFSVHGETIFARYVRGQKGQKFVEKSIENVQDRLDEMFARALQENYN